MKALRAVLKFIGDFRYYRRRGYGLADAWRLAQLTF